jgi:hypothetical protein
MDKLTNLLADRSEYLGVINIPGCAFGSSDSAFHPAGIVVEFGAAGYGVCIGGAANGAI